MTPEENSLLDATLEKIQQLVASVDTEQETLLLAAGMLSISRHIFEFYLGADQADEIFLNQTGNVDEQHQYQIH